MTSKQPAVCSVDNCTENQLALGLCYNHYHNFKYHRSSGKYTKVKDYIQHINTKPSRKIERICKDPTCTDPAKVKGFCRKHYQASKYIPAPKRDKTKIYKPCAITDCNEKEKSRGLCINHYQNYQYHQRKGNCRDVETYVQQRNADKTDAVRRDK